MSDLVDSVREQLAAAGREDVRASSQRYFKEPVPCHGVRSAEVRKIAKAGLKELDGLPKAAVFALCERLWESGYIEEVGIACEWSYAQRGRYEPEDMVTFERWVDEYVTNWAACDTHCNHSVGTLVEIYPELITRLRAWADSDHRWKKRGAAVSLIIPARRGLFLEDVFDIADTLMGDPDELVQKGFGWMLKSASILYQDEVYDFVVARKDRMPRVAYRYALEKMPKQRRTEAMKKDKPS